MSPRDDRQDARPEEITGRTVVALFPDRRRIELVIRELEEAGFARDRIGLAMQERLEPGDLLGETGGGAADGAAKGVVSGGLVGGVLGLLGSLVVPGIGPVLAGGILASMLAGAGIGAATGGVLGALAALGVPPDDASHFDSGLRAGGVLLTIDAGARTPEALAVLARHEADLGPGYDHSVPGVATGEGSV